MNRANNEEEEEEEELTVAVVAVWDENVIYCIRQGGVYNIAYCKVIHQ